MGEKITHEGWVLGTPQSHPSCWKTKSKKNLADDDSSLPTKVVEAPRRCSPHQLHLIIISLAV